MRLTRRAFFHGLAAAVATVAIASRMAPKFPEVLADGTWRYEMATDKYYYGIDTAEPWNVQIFERAAIFDSDPWTPINPKDLLRKATQAFRNVERGARYVAHQVIEEFGMNDEFFDELEAAQIISISQGALSINKMEHGALMGMQEMDDTIAMPVIYMSKGAMFQHA